MVNMREDGSSGSGTLAEKRGKAWKKARTLFALSLRRASSRYPALASVGKKPIASIEPGTDSPDLPADPKDLLKRSLVLPMPLVSCFHVGGGCPSVVQRVSIRF